MNEIEQWKDVVGAPNYQVSNFGNVRSFFQTGPQSFRRSEPRPMTIGRQTQGYLVVYPRIDGKQRCKLVHNLVAEAFIGPRPSKSHQAAHNDGNKENCRVSNIEWKTPKENCADKVLHGTQTRHREMINIDGVDCFRCTHCSEWLSIETGFYRLVSSASFCKLNSWCKDCVNSDKGRRRRKLAAERAAVEMATDAIRYTSMEKSYVATTG